MLRPSTSLASSSKFQAPVTVLVGFAAGGALDIAARRIAPEMAERIGQNVVVENVVGAGGGIAYQRLIRSKPDGSVLFYGSPNESILAPYANPALKYRPDQADLVGLGAWTSLVLCARASLEANNIDELIALGRRTSTHFSYASVGHGSLQHIAGESVRAASGLDLLHVPYKGSSPALTDLIGGQIDLAVFTLAGNTPAVLKTGKMKNLGVLANQRDPATPDLATINESKSVRNQDFTIWGGLFAPKGTPAAITDTLNAVMRDVHAMPKIANAIREAGSNTPVVRTVDETARFFDVEIKKFRAISESVDLTVKS